MGLPPWVFNFGFAVLGLFWFFDTNLLLAGWKMSSGFFTLDGDILVGKLCSSAADL